MIGNALKTDLKGLVTVTLFVTLVLLTAIKSQKKYFASEKTKSTEPKKEFEVIP